MSRDRDLMELGAEIRDLLIDNQSTFVRWEPDNGTGYELLITPFEVTAIAKKGARPLLGGTGDPGVVYVSRFYAGGVYPIRLWELDGTPRCPHPSYFAEHLARNSHDDGCALHLLFSAIAGTTPVCTWADAGASA